MKDVRTQLYEEIENGGKEMSGKAVGMRTS